MEFSKGIMNLIIHIGAVYDVGDFNPKFHQSFLLKVIRQKNIHVNKF